MSEQTKAVIISVGTELTEGVILNTHFRFLGAELKYLGFLTIRSVQIPDTKSIIFEELNRALGDSNLVLITGGLGPTSDDLTREIVAETAGVKLKFKEKIWETLLCRFTGRKISDTNKKQAYIPEGFQVIENYNGTAPAFYGWIRKTLVIALPGPPKELEPMFHRQIAPLLSKEMHLHILEELKTTVLMIPESVLEEALQKHRKKAVTWGTRVAEDRIIVSFRGGSLSDQEKAFRGLEEEFSQVRIRRGDVKPNYMLFEALKERKMRIALAESCTGGLLGKLITDIPGSSEILWGSLVVYSNSAKESLLSVDPELIEHYGAVSREVVSAMSEGILKRSGADVSLAVTGIAGPDGGSPEKPVGTVWVSARKVSGKELYQKYHFPGSREMIRRRTAISALLITECLVLERDCPYLSGPWE